MREENEVIQETREQLIIHAIKEMGVFRTNFPNNEVSALVAKAIEALEHEDDRKYWYDKGYKDAFTARAFHEQLLAEEQMDDRKMIRLLLDAMRFYEDGAIIEAKDKAIEFINRITDFEEEEKYDTYPSDDGVWEKGESK